MRYEVYIPINCLKVLRYGGVLPGAATTAPAQHISSVAAVERSISETGAAQELRALNQVRFGGCGSAFRHGKQTPR